MHSIPDAPYLPTARPDVVESTELSQAGWYENGQHGGVVSGLIARAIEAVPTLTSMETARLTIELFRIVPVVPLRVLTRIVREGKKIQLVEASVFDPDDLELARGIGLRLRRAELDLPPAATDPPFDLPQPEEADPPRMSIFGVGRSGRLLFHRYALEAREIDEGFQRLGPGAMWTRMIKPLVAGEPISPLVRAAVTGDFVNGLSRWVQPDQFVFMNADLSIHLHRMPEGEWVGVSAESRYGPGRGVATGVLFDRHGEIGRTTQSLFIAPAVT